VPTRQHVPLRVTWRQVAAFRLARHHLAGRAPARALVAVVDEMAGAQAQLLSAAQIALWARVRDLQIAHVEKALAARRIVKAGCMRRTLYLLPAAHLAVFVRGTARRAEKDIRWALGKGVPERVLERAIEAALGALDEPLTRPEIAERASRTLGVRVGTYQGGGWGRQAKLAAVSVGHLNYPVVELLHLAAARGVVCYGPNRGNEPTFVRADAWIPRFRDLPQEQAEDLLLRRYLHAFGPATVADFSLWTGITLTGARAIWARGEAGFAPVVVEGWPAWVLRKDREVLAEARLGSPPVRLLPYFDSYLLGHLEREHLAARRHHPTIYRSQGWVAPVVLVGGRVAATWAHNRQGSRLSIDVAAFEPLSRRVHARIREEARSLGAFVGAPAVEVKIG
jgi:hypothetical protein